MDGKAKFICIFLIVICYITMYKFNNYYSFNKFNFICNDTNCIILHSNKNGQTIKKQNINISNIDKFEYKLKERHHPLYEHHSKWSRDTEVYYLYAKQKNGKSFQISPIYIKIYNEGLAKRVVEELNKKLNDKPLNIDFTFKFSDNQKYHEEKSSTDDKY